MSPTSSSRLFVGRNADRRRCGPFIPPPCSPRRRRSPRGPAVRHSTRAGRFQLSGKPGSIRWRPDRSPELRGSDALWRPQGVRAAAVPGAVACGTSRAVRRSRFATVLGLAAPRRCAALLALARGLRRRRRSQDGTSRRARTRRDRARAFPTAQASARRRVRHGPQRRRRRRSRTSASRSKGFTRNARQPERRRPQRGRSDRRPGAAGRDRRSSDTWALGPLEPGERAR